MSNLRLALFGFASQMVVVISGLLTSSVWVAALIGVAYAVVLWRFWRSLTEWLAGALFCRSQLCLRCRMSTGVYVTMRAMSAQIKAQVEDNARQRRGERMH